MPKRCFVIQGYGKKQDYEQGKQFDLDASYALIKEAIKDAGLECYRGDELRTSGTIDQVMYDELLGADLVVADITTLSFNTAFELGVRLALRPYSTLVVGEKGMNFPFDVDHIFIHRYQHLGEDIGYTEAKRFRKELAQLAKKVIHAEENDSPVYTHLKQLPAKGYIDLGSTKSTAAKSGPGDVSLRSLVEQAKEAMRKGRFTEATTHWKKARKMAGKDDYIVQQLALATYKSQKPDTEKALQRAKKILKYLQPRTSFDPETLGLWAAVHKRLFGIQNKPEDLDEAIFALERGFFIRHDYYNGINLAFMLDIKASISNSEEKQELHGVARYVRRIVKDICAEAIEDPDLSDEEEYWILATFYEVSVGLGLEDDAREWKAKSEGAAKTDWMKESTAIQIAKLRKILSAST